MFVKVLNVSLLVYLKDVFKIYIDFTSSRGVIFITFHHKEESSS